MTVSLLRSRIKRAAGNKLERNHFLSNRHVLLTAKTARHGGISSSCARTFRYRPSFSRSFSLGILRDSNVSKRSFNRSIKQRTPQPQNPATVKSEVSHHSPRSSPSTNYHSFRDGRSSQNHRSTQNSSTNNRGGYQGPQSLDRIRSTPTSHSDETSHQSHRSLPKVPVLRESITSPRLMGTVDAAVKKYESMIEDMSCPEVS